MFETNVAKGIEFLNEKVPNWRQKIDLKELNAQSLCRCPLGQVFGSYFQGTELYDLNAEEVVALGFEVDLEANDTDKDYAILTDEWKRQLGEVT